MHNLCAIFAKYIDICKLFAGNLVNKQENLSKEGGFLNLPTKKFQLALRLFYQRMQSSEDRCQCEDIFLSSKLFLRIKKYG